LIASSTTAMRFMTTYSDPRTAQVLDTSPSTRPS
jgi:hypothetical protein